jgi:uncharacterized OB-fold protein
MSEEKQDIKSIVTPTSLTYEWAATGAQADFLTEIAEGKLIGQRCPGCEMVYCPPSGNCARCGLETTGKIPVEDKGTVTTFCIVRIPSENIDVKLPYCAANILLDGSDMPFIALIQECEAEEVHVGMRVEAVWKDRSEWDATFENIAYFRPSGEPDVPAETLGVWV